MFAAREDHVSPLAGGVVGVADGAGDGIGDGGDTVVARLVGDRGGAAAIGH